MENRRFPMSQMADFVRFIKDTQAKEKKNVGNGYLPLQNNAVYYICSILRKIHLRSVTYETVPPAAGKIPV